LRLRTNRDSSPDLQPLTTNFRYVHGKNCLILHPKILMSHLQ